MFDEAGKPRIFSVPEPIGETLEFSKSKSLYGGQKQDFLYGGDRRVTARTERSEFFQVSELRKKFGIFPSPRTYMEETIGRVKPRTLFHSVLRQQVVSQRGESWEFFQVPEST